MYPRKRIAKMVDAHNKPWNDSEKECSGYNTKEKPVEASKCIEVGNEGHAGLLRAVLAVLDWKEQLDDADLAIDGAELVDWFVQKFAPLAKEALMREGLWE